MAQPPTNIRSLTDKAVLELHWKDGTIHQLPYKLLRGECPCAACVDEFTGIRKLDINSIPEDIRPEQLGFSGNYALKITWSDGHSTGLYTWENLARLCQSPQVTTINSQP